MSCASSGRCCFSSIQRAASLRTRSASAMAAVRVCFSCEISRSASSRSLRRFCFSNLPSWSRSVAAIPSQRCARVSRSGYACAEGSAWNSTASFAISPETSSPSALSCDCAAASSLRSLAICAFTSRGNPSNPAKITTTIATVNSTANIRNDDLLMMLCLRLSVYRDVARVHPRVQRHRERLPLRLADAQQALAVLREKLPVIEARRSRLVVAPRVHLAAQTVHPRRLVEVERVGRILPLVDLRQVVLAQPQLFQRDAARVGVQVDFHLFIAAHAQRHAAFLVRTREFQPRPRARFHARAAVYRVIQIRHPVAGARDREDISRAGVG